MPPGDAARRGPAEDGSDRQLAEHTIVGFWMDVPARGLDEISNFSLSGGYLFTRPCVCGAGARACGASAVGLGVVRERGLGVDYYLWPSLNLVVLRHCCCSISSFTLNSAPLTGLSLYAPEANELVVTVVIFISRCDGSVISQIISPPPPPATTCMVYGTAYSTIRLSR